MGAQNRELPRPPHYSLSRWLQETAEPGKEPQVQACKRDAVQACLGAQLFKQVQLGSKPTRDLSPKSSHTLHTLSTQTGCLTGWQALVHIHVCVLDAASRAAAARCRGHRVTAGDEAEMTLRGVSRLSAQIDTSLAGSQSAKPLVSTGPTRYDQLAAGGGAAAAGRQEQKRGLVVRRSVGPSVD
ncbi:hypothetical protein NDU88_001730 [Pleurodeles waltl]|uniref:Uncharacterized protein n=1 Tax=Pleurodeles waltl TaxID=8319 RepID=A0AAV7KTL8_PLEWA|nr:hypothetical protein NDU88_001730 [Pleurodeles waltl]